MSSGYIGYIHVTKLFQYTNATELATVKHKKQKKKPAKTDADADAALQRMERRLSTLFTIFYLNHPNSALAPNDHIAAKLWSSL